MQLEGIDHVAIGVRDIEQSVKWYIEVLGFERLHEGMWEGVPTFLAKEIPELRCSPRVQMQSRPRLVTANFGCFISLFARTATIFSPRNANWKSAESNSNSRITKFRTQSIFAIPTVTRWRSLLTR